MWLNTFFPFFTPSPASNKKWAKFENDLEFQNTFMNLLNIAMYSFEFEGLPDTCNERFFKLNLILQGMAGLVKDSEMGYLTLKVTPSGNEWNTYGECSTVHGYGWNGFNKEYKNYMYGADNEGAECVICRDNDMCYPLVEYLIIYANRLTQTMRTIDVTSRKLKTPYFITCDEAQKTSVKKILEDLDFNQDSIITNKSTTPNMFQVLTTNVNPQSLVTLWNHYNNLDSAVRTLLGVKSALNQDKSERLLVDEVNADNQLTDINLKLRLESYKRFCKTVNEHFGLNISVKIREGALPNVSEMDRNRTQSNMGTENTRDKAEKSDSL